MIISTSDATLKALAVWALRIYIAALCLMGIQLACQQAFIAFGKSKISVFLALFRKIIVLIPLIYILPHFMSDNVQAVFMAEPIADVIAVTLTSILFARDFRKTIHEMEKKSAGVTDMTPTDLFYSFSFFHSLSSHHFPSCLRCIF